MILDIDLMGEKSVSKQKCNNCKCQCELYKNWCWECDYLISSNLNNCTYIKQVFDNLVITCEGGPSDNTSYIIPTTLLCKTT